MPQRSRTVLVLSDTDLQILCECLALLILQWDRYSEEEKVKRSGAADHYAAKAAACRNLYDKLQQALEC